MTSRDYFKGKRVAVIGMGPHGEMITDIKFLIKTGAIVSLYDLRSESRLKTDLIELKSFGLASHVCGSIPPDDLLDMDIIVISHEYPRESFFLKQAKDKGIVIEYPETLFFKHAPPVTIIGIIGSHGKTTVMSMLSPMIEAVCTDYDNQGFFTIDCENPGGIISNLKKTRNGDIILMRMSDHIGKELLSIRISPHVAVFTSLPKKGTFDSGPFELLSFQTYNNYIVASDDIIDAIRIFKFQPKAKMLRTKPVLIPDDWQLEFNNPFEKEYASLSFQTAKLFKVSDEIVKSVLEKWKPLKGRLEMIKRVRNIEFYNDTASVVPVSTLNSLKVISKDKKTILIMGGAKTDANYQELYEEIPNLVKIIVTVPGSGTLEQRKFLHNLQGVQVFSAPSIEESVMISLEHSEPGDRVLFSPGFDAVGLDRSRKERGERFVKAVRSI